MSERLNPVETIMWRAGREPALRMHVGNLVLLDRLPGGAALVDRLGVAAAAAPRLRRRLDTSTVPGRARWVDDPEFDADRHVRVLAVPAPGDLRTVLDLLALVEPAPFEGAGSPWDVTIVEGLAGGQGALYLRAHHVLTDGLGGIELLDLLLDESQPAEEPAPSDEQAAAPATGPGTEPEADSLVRAERRPGSVTVTVDLTQAARPIASGLTAGMAAARRLDPVGSLVRGAQRSLDAAASVAHQVAPPGGALAPLAPSSATTSRFEVLSVADARATALALGGSRNDLLVAAVAAGVGAYLGRLGLGCDELRVALPTVRHREEGLGGNWFAPTRVVVPATADHPAPRFGVVSERLARARAEAAVRVATALAPGLSRVPLRALLPVLAGQAAAVDLIATALPGLRGERHIDGARIVTSYGFGPRLGRLLNVTALGNDGRLDLGLSLDPTAIAEPALLLQCIDEAFHVFEQPPSAGGRGRASRSSSQG